MFCFCFFYCHFASQLRDPKPFKCVFAIWFSSPRLRKPSKGYTLDSRLTPLEAKNKLLSKNASRPNSSAES